MRREDGALLAYARGLAHWHARHRFCGVCGAPTASEKGGHQRRCTNGGCAAVHFPRTDPAVIMLVHDGGDRCLLGRQPTWARSEEHTSELQSLMRISYAVFCLNTTTNNNTNMKTICQ